MSDFKILKKNDLLIVFILVLLSAAGFFIFRLFHTGEGKVARVYVDNVLYGEYPLGNSDESGINRDANDDIDAYIGGNNAVSGESAAGIEKTSGTGENSANGENFGNGENSGTAGNNVTGDNRGNEENSRNEGNTGTDELRIEIPGIRGVCILVIKDGKADMISAECPDHICVHHAPISHKGETIVCLPNRVVVEIG